MHLLCLVVVFIVGCIAASEAVQGGCFWAAYPNMQLGIPGNPYTNVRSLDACQALCIMSADCKSVDFAANNSSCYLYSATEPKKSSSDFWHYDCTRQAIRDVVPIADNSGCISANYPGQITELYTSPNGVNWKFEIANFGFDWPPYDIGDIPLSIFHYIDRITFSNSDNLNYFRVLFRKSNGEAIKTKAIGPNDNRTVECGVEDVANMYFYLAPIDFNRNISLYDVTIRSCSMDPHSEQNGACELFDVFKVPSLVLLTIFHPGDKPGSFSVSVAQLYPSIELNLECAGVGTVSFTQVAFGLSSNIDYVMINVWNGSTVYQDVSLPNNTFTYNVRGNRIRTTIIPTTVPDQDIYGSFEFRQYSVYAI